MKKILSLILLIVIVTFTFASCGEKMEPENATAGLEYSIYETGAAIVKGIGKATDTDIIIPNKYGDNYVRNVSSRAFKGNTQITSLEASVLIDEEAFANCVNLKTVKISSSPENYVFMGCTSLTNVTLTNGSAIKKGAFQNCTSLSTIQLSEKYAIIFSDAFKGCTSLKNIALPEALNQFKPKPLRVAQV